MLTVFTTLAFQVRDGNLDEFFSHESQTFPPSLSKDDMLRTGNKSDLLSSLYDIQDTTQDKPSVKCIAIDGTAVVRRKSSSHSSYSNFNQVVEKLTLFGIFIWKIALKNLQEIKEVKVFIVVYYKTRKFQATGMHFFVLIRTKLNYSNFSQLKQVNFKLVDC